MIDQIRKMFAHLEWADGRSIESLRAMPAPDPDAVRVLAHVLGAEEVWLSRIEGRASTSAVWPDLDLEGCAVLAHDVHTRITRLMAALDADALGRVVSYRNSAGVPYDSRLEDILLHMVLHGMYHRGQVAAAVRRGGAAPLYTDYIAWARGGAPATKADAAR